jgi:hypothetical protein
VIVFPIISAVFSALCAIILLRDQLRKPRPDKLVWSVAFAMFALAAGADAAGRSLGWSEELARLYYATGPALVVMFLAVGELYLLFPKQMGRFAPGATLLLTAAWVTTVLNAPIDMSRLEADGWEAIERGPWMVAMTVAINSIGSSIIVGGLGWSIWKFWKSGQFRNRMIGCILIAAGTIAVGMGGTLTRLGHYEYLYIAMSIGAAMIFAGVLWTRRPDVVTLPGSTASRTAQTPAAPAPAISRVRQNGKMPLPDPAVLAETSPLDYVGNRLLTLDDAAIDRFCTEWSVPRDPRPVFDRGEARRAWRFRAQLPAQARDLYDGLPLPARRQILVLHDEVMTAEDHNTFREFAAESLDLPAHRR